MIVNVFQYFTPVGFIYLYSRIQCLYGSCQSWMRTSVLGSLDLFSARSVTLDRASRRKQGWCLCHGVDERCRQCMCCIVFGFSIVSCVVNRRTFMFHFLHVWCFCWCLGVDPPLLCHHPLLEIVFTVVYRSIPSNIVVCTKVIVYHHH